MLSLYEMYAEMTDKGIMFFEYNQPEVKAISISMRNRFAIFIDSRNINTVAEEVSVLAHEYGHCSTGATHAVSSPLDLVVKHEYKADKWAAHKLIPPEAYRNAIADGCTEVWQLAERFSVTDDFIRRTDYIYRCEGLIE